MIKQKVQEELKSQAEMLPYGSKQKIAETLGVPYDNVITACRGIAGESLSVKVLKEVRKINKREIRKMLMLNKKVSVKATKK